MAKKILRGLNACELNRWYPGVTTTHGLTSSGLHSKLTFRQSSHHLTLSISHRNSFYPTSIRNNSASIILHDITFISAQASMLKLCLHLRQSLLAVAGRKIGLGRYLLSLGDALSGPRRLLICAIVHILLASRSQSILLNWWWLLQRLQHRLALSIRLSNGLRLHVKITLCTRCDRGSCSAQSSSICRLHILRSHAKLLRHHILLRGESLLVLNSREELAWLLLVVEPLKRLHTILLLQSTILYLRLRIKWHLLSMILEVVLKLRF